MRWFQAPGPQKLFTLPSGIKPQHCDVQRTSNEGQGKPCGNKYPEVMGYSYLVGILVEYEEVRAVYGLESSALVLE